MKLKHLNIELKQWGENNGKYEAGIEYEGTRGAVKIVLDPAISNELLNFIGPVITKFATRAALEIESNLRDSVLAASQQPLIEATPLNQETP